MVHNRGDLFDNRGDDTIQTLVVGWDRAEGDVGVDVVTWQEATDHDTDIHEVTLRGRGCRAEEAKGESGKSGKSERAHDERLRRVVGEESDWSGESRRGEK